MAVEWLLVLFGLLGLVGFGLMVLITRYKRCASDEILVVFGRVGKNQASACIHGGARLVWPLFQDYKKISLVPMTIQIPLNNALSLQNIRINVPSTFTVGVSTDPLIMSNAAERLLHLSTPQIEEMAQEIILGQLRLTTTFHFYLQHRLHIFHKTACYYLQKKSPLEIFLNMIQQFFYRFSNFH